eukprot:10189711-Karenia_brevis.AAC.1
MKETGELIAEAKQIQEEKQDAKDHVAEILKKFDGAKTAANNFTDKFAEFLEDASEHVGGEKESGTV